MEITDQYWASLDKDNLLSALSARVDEYFKYLRTSNRMYVWRSSYQMYNQAMFKGPRVRTVGRHGEYLNMTVNHYRSLIQNMITMTVNQRPAFEPRATNTDVESQTQTVLARGLLDYYMREERLERYLKQAVEFALLYGEGYITCTWNATAGEAVGIDPETQTEMKTGDLDFWVYEPIDVIRSVNQSSAQANQWYICRTYRNKWDLIAKYPDFKDELQGLTNKWDPLKQYKVSMTDLWGEDIVEVYEFFHCKSDALPDGRYALFVNGCAVLQEGALPYGKLPVYRVCPAELSGTTFGYSMTYDLMPLQEMIDVVYSTIVTQQAAFGVQSIAVPRGSNISANEVRDGMTLIEFDPKAGPPQPLNLLQTPKEVYEFSQILERLMETLSGVNSVARGNPESSLKSGAALALVQSMAVQFSQNLQHSYVQLLEDVGTAMINTLREYAAVPRVAMIAGKSNRGHMRKFSSKDLTKVNRVQVDAANPMTRTTAGKVELATLMLQNKLINHPDELLQVMQTGNLETMTEGKTNELLAIKEENEMLSEGKPVQTFITDDHLVHILEHKCVVSQPNVRENPEVVKVTTDHIFEHYKFLSDPGLATLLQLLGQVPVPPQGAGAPMQGAVQGSIPPTANEVAAGNMPGMPNMPTNPLSGGKPPGNQ